MGNINTKITNLKLNVIFDNRYATALLNKAEQSDAYLEKCYDDTLNAYSRSKLSYSPNTIPLREKNYLESFIEMSKSFIPIRLLNDLHTVNIIQLMPSSDGGMPHTRPNNIICYPNISQFYSQTTLIHELWHIHQRTYKELWTNVFQSIGWTVWTKSMPEKLEQICRYNPDTIDSPFWIYNNTWIPIPVFKNITRPHISEVDIWFYNPHDNHHITYIPSELIEMFPDLPDVAYEHPREITAYVLSDYDKYKESKGVNELIKSIGQISISTH